MSEPRTVSRVPRARPQRSLAYLLKQEDFVAGASMVIIAAFLSWTGRSYSIGSLVNMGPGYFPRVLCVIIGLAGLGIIVGGFRKGFPKIESEFDDGRIMPLLIIIVAFIFFAFAAELFGLLLTSAIFSIIVSYAHPGRRLLEAVLLTAGLLVLVFALWELIGIQLPLLPEFV